MTTVVSARLLARLKFALASVLFVALQANSQAQAQTQPYPSQPIRIVIGYAAEGATDIVARSVMSGDTQYTFASMPIAMPQVQAGKLRALAVTTKARSPQLPDIPSVEEAAVVARTPIKVD